MRNAIPALALVSIALLTACIAWRDSRSVRPGRASVDALFDYGDVFEVIHEQPPYNHKLPPQLDPQNYDRGPLRGPPTAHFRGEQRKCDWITL